MKNPFKRSSRRPVNPPQTIADLINRELTSMRRSDVALTAVIAILALTFAFSVGYAVIHHVPSACSGMVLNIDASTGKTWCT